MNGTRLALAMALVTASAFYAFGIPHARAAQSEPEEAAAKPTPTPNPDDQEDGRPGGRPLSRQGGRAQYKRPRGAVDEREREPTDVRAVGDGAAGAEANTDVVGSGSGGAATVDETNSGN